MTVEQLVERFVTIALEESEAVTINDVPSLTKLYWMMDAVNKELQSRPGDQRRALLPLYSHSDAQVRVKAAKSTLAVAPVAARSLLEEIKKSGPYSQSMQAHMSLFNLDRGIFKPT